MLSSFQDSYIETVPRFTKQPPLEIYAVEKERVIIPCYFECINCTEKIIVNWKKDEYDLHATIGVHINDTNLVLNSYRPDDQIGSYVCIVTYRTLSIRSIPCRVYTAVLPDFSISSQTALKKGTVLFLCIDHALNITEHLEFQWLKNGESLELDSRILVRDGYLFIKEVLSSDVGTYSCQYTWKKSSITRKSKSVFLNITTSSGLLSLTTIVSPYQMVLINQNVTATCLTNGLPPDTVVHLLKLQNDMEIKLAESIAYVTHTWVNFKDTDKGSYICEVEIAQKRWRKEFNLGLKEHSDLDHNGFSRVNAKIDSRLSFGCNSTGSFNATIVWYHNAAKVSESNHWKFSGSWLTISNIQLQHAGIYQCIIQNSRFAESKEFYLTVESSAFSPRNLTIFKLSPNKVRLAWLSPKNKLLKQRLIYYRVYWKKTDGEVWDGFSTETEYVINLYGGIRYTFTVCTFYTKQQDIKDCVEKNSTMMESAPLYGPTLKKPMYTKEHLVKLSWKPIPLKYAHGIIRNYTVFCQNIFDKSNGTKIYHYGADKTSTIIALNSNMTYKVWIVATNGCGASPMSEVYVLGKKLKENLDSNDIKVNIYWDNYLSGKRFAVLKWTVSNMNKSVTGFRIFYITIPYTDYWKSVKTVDVDRDNRTYSVHGLSVKQLHRFSIAPIFQWNTKNQQGRLWLGRRASVLLHEKFNMKKHFRCKLVGCNLVQMPSSLTCLSTHTDSLIISWKPPATEVHITDYIIKIKSEKTTMEVKYNTTNTHIVIHNLTDVWYAVRVEADNVYLKKVIFLEAGFISCRTKVHEPSEPRELKYHIFYHKSQKKTYIRVKWKQPLYVGDGVYSYDISTLDKSTNSANFPFAPNFYHVIMEQQKDDWIRSPAIITRSGKVKVNITVRAVNSAGKGKPAYITTEEIGPLPSGIAAESTVETHSSYASGIVVGVTVSAIFLLAFIVVCILKEPYKRLCKKDDNEKNDYLYTQRLKQLDTFPTMFTLDKRKTENHARPRERSSWFARDKLLTMLKIPRKSRIVRDGSSSSTTTEMLYVDSSCSCNQSQASSVCSKCKDLSSLCVSSASEEIEYASVDVHKTLS